MEKRIDITPDESCRVEQLFDHFNAYVNILSYFGDKATEENSVFDRKWAEAVEIDIELTHLKRELEKKYKPEGHWDSFEFDFIHHQIIFYGKL